MSEEEIVIIRRRRASVLRLSSVSSALSDEEQNFLQSVASEIEQGCDPSGLDLWRVKYLVAKAL